MKLLIEEYPYKVNDVLNVLDGLFTLQDIKGNISVSYVGYYYNPKIQDVVFILPKVLIDEHGKVFAKYDPAKLIDIDNAKIELHEAKFIYEFAVWIHRAIVVYNNTHESNGIILCEQIQGEGKGAKRKANTWLDVILSLIRFNRENRSFFTFVLKNIHSGYNKINWTRTISSTTAVVQNESPVYLNPINKRRQINFDEELIVIFFSILHYVSERFGFRTELPFGFPLIKGAKFERYIKGYGRTRLRQIKYKYFSDVTMRLWDLCYAFFNKAYQIKTSISQREYLLAKSFHIVFEAIIDELIGDNDVPKGLKEQDDGKLVDHFYTYEGLLINREEQNDIYYIGDSKYYKIGSQPGRESVYKQYTYARNVIQWNLNLFLNPSAKEDENDRYRTIELRDDVTEGYNVIPNFFISANIDPVTLSYKDRTVRREGAENICRQFENRLYDRDTLIVSHYDVNFLFVLALYARNNSGTKAQWKLSVRRKFREEIQAMLSDRFDFYAMSARPGINGETWIKSHFNEVLGKTFSPFQNKDIFSLALDRDDKFKNDNDKLLTILRKNFIVVECPIGSAPTTIIAKQVAIEGNGQAVPTSGKFLTGVVRKTERNEDGRKAVARTFQAIYNGDDTEYIMERMPSGNLAEARFFLPIIENSIPGYYEIGAISFGSITQHYFDAGGNEVPVLHPTLKLRISNFRSFDEPLVKGVVPAMAAQIWDNTQLQKLIDKN